MFFCPLKTPQQQQQQQQQQSSPISINTISNGMNKWKGGVKKVLSHNNNSNNNIVRCHLVMLEEQRELPLL